MTARLRSIIVDFIQKHNVSHDEWTKLAIVTARANIETAPPSIRVMFVGQPSKTPQEAKELAEIFSLLVCLAEDRAACSNAFYRPEEIWNKAIQLWGVQHG